MLELLPLLTERQHPNKNQKLLDKKNTTKKKLLPLKVVRNKQQLRKHKMLLHQQM
jgi:hypothetical protein